MTAGPVVYHRRYATMRLNIAVTPTTGTALPGGNLQIYSNGVSLGTVQLQFVNGVEMASVSLYFFQSGTYTITAGYLGNSAFAPCMSDPLTVRI